MLRFTLGGKTSKSDISMSAHASVCPASDTSFALNFQVHGWLSKLRGIVEM